MTARRGACALATAAVAGCAAGPGPAAGPPPAEPAGFVLYESPPTILAGGLRASGPARVAERIDARAAALSEAPRRVEPAMLPFLRASPVGARFLASAPARALARGEPAAYCPASGLAAEAETAERAAERALGACVAALAARDAPPDCACRLLAVDDTLLAPRDAFAYAQGVSARALGLPEFAGAPLVAEERAEGSGRRVRLRGAAGPAGTLEIDAEGGAVMRLADGRAFAGRSDPLGWRRGRLAEVVRLRSESGEAVTVLIGFEPEELAALAAP